MAGIGVGFEVDGSDVFLVCSLWFTVNGALVNSALLAGRRADSINVNNWHLFVKHLEQAADLIAAFSALSPAANGTRGIADDYVS